MSFRLHASCDGRERQSDYYVEVDDRTVTAAAIIHVTQLAIVEQNWRVVYNRLYCPPCRAKARRKTRQIMTGG